MTTGKQPPKSKRGFRMLTAEILDGFAIEQLKCRSCSGYGNCGYKSMFLKPEGGVVSLCMNRRKTLQEQRDQGGLADDFTEALA